MEHGTPLKFHKISYKFQISVDTFTNHRYTAYSKTYIPLFTIYFKIHVRYNTTNPSQSILHTGPRAVVYLVLFTLVSVHA